MALLRVACGSCVWSVRQSANWTSRTTDAEFTMKLLETGKYEDFATLNDTVRDRHFAKSLAEIGMNWGLVEYWLFQVLKPIDRSEAKEWMDAFFANRNLESKKKKILQKMKRRYPDCEQLLIDALKLLDSVCARRNILAHGLWHRPPRGDRDQFEVQPMHMIKREFARAITVDSQFLSTLTRDIRHLIRDLALTSAAVIALDFMAKRKRRGMRERPSRPTTHIR